MNMFEWMFEHRAGHFGPVQLARLDRTNRAYACGEKNRVEKC